MTDSQLEKYYENQCQVIDVFCYRTIYKAGVLKLFSYFENNFRAQMTEESKSTFWTIEQPNIRVILRNLPGFESAQDALINITAADRYVHILVMVTMF
jgi:hypothetical protein